MSDPDPPLSPTTEETTDGIDEIFNLSTLAGESVSRALDGWRQGDLVSGVRIFWADTAGHDPLSDLHLDAPADGGWSVTRWSQEGVNISPDGDLSVITSQTCDIGGTGPGARHPTVQVSPLIRLDHLGSGRAEAVRRNRTTDMIVIPDVNSYEWAADLRISLPVSKNVLVAQTPRRGFVNEASARAFAERVAAKLRRPAAHDGISDHLVDELDQFVKRERAAGAVWLDRVEQFRVQIEGGSLLEPENVGILVLVLDGPLSPADQAPLRQWWARERKPFGRATGGAALLPLRFLQLDRTKVTDYRESVPLRIPELGQPTFW
jgi:hypothetical protein